MKENHIRLLMNIYIEQFSVQKYTLNRIHFSKSFKSLIAE